MTFSMEDSEIHEHHIYETNILAPYSTGPKKKTRKASDLRLHLSNKYHLEHSLKREERPQIAVEIGTTESQPKAEEKLTLLVYRDQQSSETSILL